MPRIHFQQQLAELKDKLLAMARPRPAGYGVGGRRLPSARPALCQYVRENETAINAAHLEVDEIAFELLAKEQPMAIDLRFILCGHQDQRRP